MKTYIFQNQILTYSKAITGIATSTDIADRETCHVALSAAQVAFSEANPNASVLEVYNMKLNEPAPVTPIPSAELRRRAYQMESDELFRIYLIYKDLEKTPEEIEAARVAWISKRDEIKSMYP
ncbi:MAG TPA: hypothetical protein VIK55_19345 [Paludibacter sp.]